MTHNELIEALGADDEIIEASLQWEDIDDLKNLISLIIQKAAELQDNKSSDSGNVLHFVK